MRVSLALLPGMICYVLFFGWGVVIQSLIAVSFALLLETILLKLRGKPVMLFLKDGSAVVTALLFALTISPFTPWWINLTGVTFALVFAKHLYGGLGYNPFNPAMAGYVFVLLCFPAQLNSWPPPPGIGEITPAFNDYLSTIFSHATPIDALSGASPLNNMQSQLGRMAMVSEVWRDPVYGIMAGRGWEWINLAYLFGGMALLLMGVIKWRIPAAVVTGMLVSSMVLNLYDPELYAGPLFHLFAGGTMLAAFFIATDPVTAAATPRGRLIYGLLIGMLAYCIRVWGSYPDGFAFAVLIANAAVPLIDLYTRPKVLGEMD